MTDIAIAAADVGGLAHLLTVDPSCATPALIQLATQPPAAADEVLQRMTELLLNAGADVNHHEVLYHACEHRRHGVLDALLAAPRLEPAWLSYCLLRKLDFDDDAGVEKMLRAGADPNLRSRQGDREMSLHHAIRRGRGGSTIQLLMAHHARPDIINIHNHTARQQAIRFGRTDFGADPEEATPLDHWLYGLWHSPAATSPPAPLGKQDYRLLPEAAWMQKHAAVENMLNAGFPVDATTHDDLQAIDFAAYHNDQAMTALLIRHGASQAQYDAAVEWLRRQ